MSDEHIHREFEKDALFSILSETEKLANVGGWEWDMVKDEWTFSDNWLRIHGCSKRRLTTSELMAIAHPDDRPDIQKAFDKAVAEGANYEIEHRIVRFDTGEERYIRACGSVELDRNGKAVKLFGSAQDVTGRKQAEIKLLSSEIKYRQLYENAPVMIHSIDQNGKILMVSDHWLDEMGYKREEVIGRPSIDFLTAESKQSAINEHLPKFFKDGTIKDIPYQMVKKDGGIIDVLLSATSEKDQDGNITRSFAVITNISERVRAEEASRKLSKRLQMVLEAVDDPVWDWRMDTGEVYFSPNWYSVLGYEPYELPQTYETWAGLLHPEDSALAEKTIGDHGKNGLPFKMEFRMRTKGGDWKWLLGRGRVVEKDDAGRPIRMLGTNVDITERKHTEALLERVRYSIDKVSDTILWVDENAGFMDANEGACRNLGYDYEELMTKTVPDIDPCFPQERWPSHWQEIKQCRKMVFESVHQTKAGKRYPVEITIHHQRYQDRYYNYVFARDITVRKQAETAIRENESKLKQAQSLGKIGNWEFDLETKKINWSNEVFRLFERDPVEGPPDFEENMAYYHFEDSDRLRKQVQAAVEKGIAAEDDYRVKLPSGRSVWHHGKIFTEKNDLGKTVRLLGTVQDITERKILESSLAIEKKRLSMLLEAFPGFIYLQAPDNSIVYANQYFKRHFGDPTYKKCHELLWNREKPCEQCHTFKVFDTKAPYSWEWSETPNGKIYKIHDFPFIDVDGSELVLEIGIDITSQKMAEYDLQKERERLNVTLQSIGDGVITTDVNGKVSIINRMAEYLTGWSEAEAAGRNLQEVFHIVSEHTRERCDDPVEKVLTSNTVVGLANDTVLIARDGSERIIADSGAPIIDGKNNTVGVVLVFRDITEKLELETQLRHAHKMEAIGNLAGGIAHEFNNVLGIIIGNTELAMDDVERWHPIMENLSEIKSASLRARDVVKQLLSFSRKIEIRRQPIDIRIIVKETIKLLRASIPSTIEIRERFAGQIDTVVADPTQVHQLLINLCNNAAYSMGDDGGILSIELNYVTLDYEQASKHPDLHPGAYVRFSVSDTGCGIPVDVLDKIFEPYFTTKEVGKGTGMGLAVVHGIVKTHEGAIVVDSAIGCGTAFHVFLPSSDRAAYRTEPPEKTLPQGKERILFVDDEQSIVMLCGRTLAKLGYQVTSNTDPIRTLEHFKAAPYAFDLIISDMTMPNMTGDRLARECLKIRPDIPVIICTGYSQKMSPEKAEELGVKSLLAKPLEMSELANAVRIVLDESQR